MMITLTEWAKILTSLHNNDGERKVALLALADELPEKGGRVLREHTDNIAGECLKPVMHRRIGINYVSENSPNIHQPCWISHRWTGWVCGSPLSYSLVTIYLYNRLQGTKNDFCCLYETRELAWLDLLYVLQNKMKRMR